ncbi:sensor histidine kinase [Halovulum sp. GXIMD14793]
MSGSLRRQVILGGVLWAAAVIALGGLIVLRFVDAQAVRHFDDDLNDFLLHLTNAVERAQGDPSQLETLLTHPAYARPYSGHYWQIKTPDGQIVTSRSLFDATLDPPKADSAWEVDFAGTDRLRALSRNVVFENGPNWHLTVAETLSPLLTDRAVIKSRMLIAFAVLTGLAALIAGSLVNYGLRPLARLQRDVSDSWEKGDRMRSGDYPAEVAPLVDQLNDLLDRNTSIVDRARRQAADLAHALNTPSAILRNEIDSLDAKGTDVARAQEALARIDAQITRSLARIRSSTSSGQVTPTSHIAYSVERILRAVGPIAEREEIILSSRVDDSLHIRMDRQDFEEALGNLTENAIKWADSLIRITARSSRAGEVEILVEDDGPGIPPENYNDVLSEGKRLDTSVPGTGLGLSIVSDLAAAYGGEVKLAKAEDLTGLRVVVTLPGGKI